jgi:hypothetical protein
MQSLPVIACPTKTSTCCYPMPSNQSSRRSRSHLSPSTTPHPGSALADPPSPLSGRSTITIPRMSIPRTPSPARVVAPTFVMLSPPVPAIPVLSNLSGVITIAGVLQQHAEPLTPAYISSRFVTATEYDVSNIASNLATATVDLQGIVLAMRGTTSSLIRSRHVVLVSILDGQAFEINSCSR